MKTKKARIISPNWKIQQKKNKRSTEIGVDCVSFSNRLISHFQLFQISLHISDNHHRQPVTQF